MFSLRIVTADHYRAPPIKGLDVGFSDFRSSEIKYVPVVRIFGATPAGQKTCLHLHGIFPYIYVSVPGNRPTEAYMEQLASSLDRALNISSMQACSSTQHVYKITLVAGIPFYGFHAKKKLFMKIYFYNPFIIKKAVELLQSGAIMNVVFQPYEAHIPFLLQVFIDYNLYGMNMITMAGVKFRKKDPNDIHDVRRNPNNEKMFNHSFIESAHNSNLSMQYWDYDTIPCTMFLDEDIARISSCELEVDAVAGDILNRQQGNTQVCRIPGLADIWQDEKERRKQNDMSSQFTPNTSQERSVSPIPGSEKFYRERLRLAIRRALSPLSSPKIKIDSSIESELEEGEVLDEDDEQIDEEESETEMCTSSSHVELHFSQIEAVDVLSRPPIKEHKPVVDEETIQNILSQSSNSQPISQNLDNTQDRSLLRLLNSLANDGMEEDSILSGRTTHEQEEEEELDEEEETLEMSQPVWDESEDDKSESTCSPRSSSDENEMSTDFIPQSDGPADEKPDLVKKKRLGTSNCIVRNSLHFSNKQPVVILNRYKADNLTHKIEKDTERQSITKFIPSCLDTNVASSFQKLKQDLMKTFENCKSEKVNKLPLDLDMPVIDRYDYISSTNSLTSNFNLLPSDNSSSKFSEDDSFDDCMPILERINQKYALAPETFQCPTNEGVSSKKILSLKKRKMQGSRSTYTKCPCYQQLNGKLSTDNPKVSHDRILRIIQGIQLLIPKELTDLSKCGNERVLLPKLTEDQIEHLKQKLKSSKPAEPLQKWVIQKNKKKDPQRNYILRLKKVSSEFNCESRKKERPFTYETFPQNERVPTSEHIFTEANSDISNLSTSLHVIHHPTNSMDCSESLKALDLKNRKRHSSEAAIENDVNNVTIALASQHKQLEDGCVERAKRSKVDYSPHAFSHIYYYENFCIRAPNQEKLKKKDNYCTSPSKSANFDGRIKFKGSKSLRVLVKRLDILKHRLQSSPERKVLSPTPDKGRLSLKLLKKRISGKNKIWYEWKIPENAIDEVVPPRIPPLKIQTKSPQKIYNHLTFVESPKKKESQSISKISTYFDLTNDYNTDYQDCMFNMGYLSPTTSSRGDNSPPQCWSPTADIMSKNNLLSQSSHLSKRHEQEASGLQRHHQNSNKTLFTKTNDRHCINNKNINVLSVGKHKLKDFSSKHNSTHKSPQKCLQFKHDVLNNHQNKQHISSDSIKKQTTSPNYHLCSSKNNQSNNLPEANRENISLAATVRKSSLHSKNKSDFCLTKSLKISKSDLKLCAKNNPSNFNHCKNQTSTVKLKNVSNNSLSFPDDGKMLWGRHTKDKDPVNTVSQVNNNKSLFVKDISQTVKELSPLVQDTNADKDNDEAYSLASSSDDSSIEVPMIWRKNNGEIGWKNVDLEKRNLCNSEHLMDIEKINTDSNDSPHIVQELKGRTIHLPPIVISPETSLTDKCQEHENHKIVSFSFSEKQTISEDNHSIDNELPCVVLKHVHENNTKTTSSHFSSNSGALVSLNHLPEEQTHRSHQEVDNMSNSSVSNIVIKEVTSCKSFDEPIYSHEHCETLNNRSKLTDTSDSEEILIASSQYSSDYKNNNTDILHKNFTSEVFQENKDCSFDSSDSVKKMPDICSIGSNNLMKISNTESLRNAFKDKTLNADTFLSFESEEFVKENGEESNGSDLESIHSINSSNRDVKIGDSISDRVVKDPEVIIMESLSENSDIIEEPLTERVNNWNFNKSTKQQLCKKQNEEEIRMKPTHSSEEINCRNTISANLETSVNKETNLIDNLSAKDHVEHDQNSPIFENFENIVKEALVEEKMCSEMPTLTNELDEEANHKKNCIGELNHQIQVQIEKASISQEVSSTLEEESNIYEWNSDQKYELNYDDREPMINTIQEVIESLPKILFVESINDNTEIKSNDEKPFSSHSFSKMSKEEEVLNKIEEAVKLLQRKNESENENIDEREKDFEWESDQQNTPVEKERPNHSPMQVEIHNCQATKQLECSSERSQIDESNDYELKKNVGSPIAEGSDIREESDSAEIYKTETENADKLIRSTEMKNTANNWKDGKNDFLSKERKCNQTLNIEICTMISEDFTKRSLSISKNDKCGIVNEMKEICNHNINERKDDALAVDKVEQNVAKSLEEMQNKINKNCDYKKIDDYINHITVDKDGGVADKSIDFTVRKEKCCEFPPIARDNCSNTIEIDMCKESEIKMQDVTPTSENCQRNIKNTFISDRFGEHDCKSLQNESFEDENSNNYKIDHLQSAKNTYSNKENYIVENINIDTISIGENEKFSKKEIQNKYDSEFLQETNIDKNNEVNDENKNCENICHESNDVNDHGSKIIVSSNESIPKILEDSKKKTSQELTQIDKIVDDNSANDRIAKYLLTEETGNPVSEEKGIKGLILEEKIESRVMEKDEKKLADENSPFAEEKEQIAVEKELKNFRLQIKKHENLTINEKGPVCSMLNDNKSGEVIERKEVEEYSVSNKDSENGIEKNNDLAIEVEKFNSSIVETETEIFLIKKNECENENKTENQVFDKIMDDTKSVLEEENFISQESIAEKSVAEEVDYLCVNEENFIEAKDASNDLGNKQSSIDEKETERILIEEADGIDKIEKTVNIFEENIREIERLNVHEENVEKSVRAHICVEEQELESLSESEKEIGKLKTTDQKTESLVIGLKDIEKALAEINDCEKAFLEDIKSEILNKDNKVKKLFLDDKQNESCVLNEKETKILFPEKSNDNKRGSEDIVLEKNEAGSRNLFEKATELSIKKEVTNVVTTKNTGEYDFEKEESKKSISKEETIENFIVKEKATKSKIMTKEKNVSIISSITLNEHNDTIKKDESEKFLEKEDGTENIIDRKTGYEILTPREKKCFVKIQRLNERDVIKGSHIENATVEAKAIEQEVADIIIKEVNNLNEGNRNMTTMENESMTEKESEIGSHIKKGENQLHKKENCNKEEGYNFIEDGIENMVVEKYENENNVMENETAEICIAEVNNLISNEMNEILTTSENYHDTVIPEKLKNLSIDKKSEPKEKNEIVNEKDGKNRNAEFIKENNFIPKNYKIVDNIVEINDSQLDVKSIENIKMKSVSEDESVLDDNSIRPMINEDINTDRKIIIIDNESVKNDIYQSAIKSKINKVDDSIAMQINVNKPEYQKSNIMVGYVDHDVKVNLVNESNKRELLGDKGESLKKIKTLNENDDCNIHQILDKGSISTVTGNRCKSLKETALEKTQNEIYERMKYCCNTINKNESNREKTTNNLGLKNNQEMSLITDNELKENNNLILENTKLKSENKIGMQQKNLICKILTEKDSETKVKDEGKVDKVDVMEEEKIFETKSKQENSNHIFRDKKWGMSFFQPNKECELLKEKETQDFLKEIDNIKGKATHLAIEQENNEIMFEEEENGICESTLQSANVENFKTNDDLNDFIISVNDINSSYKAKHNQDNPLLEFENEKESAEDWLFIEDLDRTSKCDKEGSEIHEYNIISDALTASCEMKKEFECKNYILIEGRELEVDTIISLNESYENSEHKTVDDESDCGDFEDDSMISNEKNIENVHFSSYLDERTCSDSIVDVNKTVSSNFSSQNSDPLHFKSIVNKCIIKKEVVEENNFSNNESDTKVESLILSQIDSATNKSSIIEILPENNVSNDNLTTKTDDNSKCNVSNDNLATKINDNLTTKTDGNNKCNKELNLNDSSCNKNNRNTNCFSQERVDNEVPKFSKNEIICTEETSISGDQFGSIPDKINDNLFEGSQILLPDSNNVDIRNSTESKHSEQYDPQKKNISKEEKECDSSFSTDEQSNQKENDNISKITDAIDMKLSSSSPCIMKRQIALVDDLFKVEHNETLNYKKEYNFKLPLEKCLDKKISVQERKEYCRQEKTRKEKVNKRSKTVEPITKFNFVHKRHSLKRKHSVCKISSKFSQKTAKLDYGNQSMRNFEDIIEPYEPVTSPEINYLETDIESIPEGVDSPSDDDDEQLNLPITRIWYPAFPPPLSDIESLTKLGIPSAQHLRPFCKNSEDLKDQLRTPLQTKEVQSNLVSDLPDFSGVYQHNLHAWRTIVSGVQSKVNSSFDVAEEINKSSSMKAAFSSCRNVILIPSRLPPSPTSTKIWLTLRKLYDHINLIKESKNSENIEKSDSEGELEKPVLVLQNKPTEKDNVIVNSQSLKKNSMPKLLKINITPASEFRIKEAQVNNSPIKTVLTGSPNMITSSNNTEQSSYSKMTHSHELFDSDSSSSSSSDSSSSSSSDSSSSSSSSSSSTLCNTSSDNETIKEMSYVIPKYSTPHSNILKMPSPDYTPIGETEIVSILRESEMRSKRHLIMQDEVDFKKFLLSSQFKALLENPALKSITSQLEGPSLSNSYGFKLSLQNLQEARSMHEVQHLTLMSIEMHARTREEFRPDPEIDQVLAIFYTIETDTPGVFGPGTQELSGVIIFDRTQANQQEAYHRINEYHINLLRRHLLIRSGITNLNVTFVQEEKILFEVLVELVKRWDPDILIGYELEMLSWGYLIRRAAHLGITLCPLLARVNNCPSTNNFLDDDDDLFENDLHIVGRIVLNLWKIMKHEVTLNIYTFENIAFHVLHERIPLFSFKTLTSWLEHKTDLYRWRFFEHYLIRVRGNLRLLQQLNVIERTSELARLFGIQFYCVFSRGSQYRVESMMLRMAKPMSYIALSPSPRQRARMAAPECIQLIMEPESKFYTDPVLVLDFQSLYPSIIIAYNYCYSTCLGRVEHLGRNTDFEFGCATLKVPISILRKLDPKTTISPNGVVFVKSSIRKGILPRMLEEILNTRIMVKKAMRKHKDDKAVQRLLDARQLGLKLISNVTYGYTSANYSGRMPCVEIGDSILSKARETLERAIKLVECNKDWAAKVVYGDTDSMFVLLKGRSKEDAFHIGQEIADAVTQLNPKPVKLKFEKIYLPCLLQTKKRYVGYMYETLDQKEPVFDAKGIETVRRDTCPAVSKILEKSLRILFSTKDVSEVKQYVQRQLAKSLEGRTSLQDFIFAKTYRGRANYRKGACVPALEITKRLLRFDRCAEPRTGERVPYIIVCGSPGLPLIQLVRQPCELLQDSNLILNAKYYITKQIIPVLGRCFSLLGVDVNAWYSNLPKVVRINHAFFEESDYKKGTITQYFTSMKCPVCGEITPKPICSKCCQTPQQAVYVLSEQIRQTERRYHSLAQICHSCTGQADGQLRCISLDCPVFFRIATAAKDLTKAPGLAEIRNKILNL